MNRWWEKRDRELTVSNQLGVRNATMVNEVMVVERQGVNIDLLGVPSATGVNNLSPTRP